MNDKLDPLGLEARVAELERQVAELNARFAEHEIPDLSPEWHGTSAPPPLPKQVPLEPIPLAPPRLASPPVAPVREPVTEPAKLADRPDVREVLRRWNLWPPEGEGSFEVQVGAWWATRIGALLAVIGVVFFGLYIAHGTPPWVRLVQLAAVAFAATGLGHWLERREAKFGGVIFGGGLALIFFAGFAAYAVPAVKILDQPVLAVAVQALAVAGIAGASLWKNRSNLATMAIVFGFVTCFFSFFEQLQNISLVAALLLAATGVVLWLARSWLPPLACSLPGAYAVFAAILLWGWADDRAPSLAVALAFPVAAFLLFSAADFLGLVLKGGPMGASERRLFAGANAAGAAGLGLWATTSYFPASIVVFYLVFGGLFLLAAVVYYRRNRDDELAHVWFAAAMGFVALALVELLDARTRWIALAVQSLVVLFTARRTRLWTAEAVMGAAWVASAALFLGDTAASGRFANPGPAWSLWGGAALLHLVLSGLLLSLQASWFADRPVRIGAIRGDASENEIRQGRKQLNLLYAASFGVVASAAAIAGFSEAFLPAGAMTIALLLGLIAVLSRHWIAGVAALFPFVVSQLSLWLLPHPVDPVWSVWLNAALTTGTGIGIASAVQLAIAHGRLKADRAGFAFGVSNLFWLISLQALLVKIASLETAFFAAGAVALLLAGFAGWRRIDRLADLVAAPVLLGLGAMAFARMEGLSYLPPGGNPFLIWAGVAGIFVAVIAREAWERVRGLAHLFPTESFARRLGAIGATLAGLLVVGREFDYPALPAALGIAGLAVAFFRRWPGWSPAVGSAAVFLFAGHFTLVIALFLDRGGETLAALLLAGSTIAYAVLIRAEDWVRSDRVRRNLQGVMAGLAIASLYLLFLTRTGALEPFTTVFWGLSAIAVFLAGLIWRVKPLRVVGLVGLGLCLPRIFLVDIHSTFYRIAAFVAVGVVLLTVGFLYHKFRNRIAGGTVAEEAPDQTARDYLE